MRAPKRRRAALGSRERSHRHPTADLSARLVAEFVGTAFLLIGVVGSGIMAQRLSNDVGLQLLQNAFATGAVLVALILAFGPASGAHFNPAVTIAARTFGLLTTRDTVCYVGVQVAGGALGVVVANLMFDLPAVEWSTTARSGSHLWLAEVVATLGLLIVIFGPVRSGRSSVAAFSVGAYIAGAYYFTSSTSFANPAVSVARTLSDTFAGIDPTHVPAFVAAQLVGMLAAVGVIAVVYPAQADDGVLDVVPDGAGDRSEPAPSDDGGSTAASA